MFHFNDSGGVNIKTIKTAKTIRVISAALLSCCFILSVAGCGRSISRDKRPEHDTSVMMPANTYILKDSVEVKGRTAHCSSYITEAPELCWECRRVSMKVTIRRFLKSSSTRLENDQGIIAGLGEFF